MKRQGNNNNNKNKQINHEQTRFECVVFFTPKFTI